MISVFDQTQVIIQPSVSKESIAEDVATFKATGEGDFSKFIGGWEMPYSKLDNLIPVLILPTDDEGKRFKWSDKFLNRVNEDKTKCFIMFGDPHNGTQIVSKSNETFISMYDYFLEADFYTKSAMITLLSGYTSGEVI